MYRKVRYPNHRHKHSPSFRAPCSWRVYIRIALHETWTTHADEFPSFSCRTSWQNSNWKFRYSIWPYHSAVWSPFPARRLRIFSACRTPRSGAGADWTIPLAPSTNKSAPTINKTNPITINMLDKIIVKIPFLLIIFLVLLFMILNNFIIIIFILYFCQLLFKTI